MNRLTRSDLQLLDALQNDTGLSQIELAEQTGMSRTSVWRRIRELEDSGLIEARVAYAESQKLLGLQIHVLLSVSMVEHSDKTRKRIRNPRGDAAGSDGMLFCVRRPGLPVADYFKGHGLLQ